ncbi:hypothetical protein [Streptomyces nitrosporeus]|uniref:hypothetical protein n=1 Tax=Streptomyces nitrosporeus TaxID=28894 RepID=UPI00167D312C|nr:hypothetical protein [Streptomyces nitrosporeus]GGZ27775.1 hypothetical protein GCM10010327_67720 [Streptomyces nitrosporeus]
MSYRSDKELARIALAAIEAGRVLSTPEKALADTGLTDDELRRAEAYLRSTGHPILGP